MFRRVGELAVIRHLQVFLSNQQKGIPRLRRCFEPFGFIKTNRPSASANLYGFSFGCAFRIFGSESAIGGITLVQRG
ncbi:hypothetical protein, partial [Ruegeria sp.]|uniref:hypothetical protein n=1 Tax=Ruegeria sp. TaxID=1879320 RepID=UPI00232688DD